MKLDSPTIYVPHKVSGVWCNSAFSFDGKVDLRRVKREILKAFKRGGEVVNPQYIDACISKSLEAAKRRETGILVSREPVDISEAEYVDAGEA